MKSFEERIAEINRRSEAILKQRRQRRKHILTVCIPLVLCVVVLMPIVPPAMCGSSGTSAAPESSNEGSTDIPNIGGLPEADVGSVVISGKDISQTYTSPEDVQRILELISAIASAPETDGDEIWDYNFSEGSSGVPGDTETENGYRLRISSGDGTSTEYLLLDSMLINQTAREVFRPEENVLSELKDALGIP